MRALFLRAQIHAERDAGAEALRSAQDVLALDPAHPGAGWIRGRILLEQGKLEEAEAALQASIRDSGAKPNVPAMFDLARLRARQERPKETLVLLRALEALGAYRRESLDIHPEFRLLEKDEDFRMFISGALSSPHGSPP